MAVADGHDTGLDLPVTETWERLVADPEALLIDVRTRAEWAFVGMADLTSIGRQPILVEWLMFPDNRINPGFVEELRGRLEAVGAGADTKLYFICRSGGRSLQAARAMIGAGYRHCLNVAEGFEGPLDSERHRGRISGWKASGLPWLQG